MNLRSVSGEDVNVLVKEMTKQKVEASSTGSTLISISQREGVKTLIPNMR